jgi:hypothetical protein
VQQINYLRAVLKEIAARDPGIKTSAHSDAMGLAWHRLHEAYYWLRRLQRNRCSQATALRMAGV